jgi:large subunit ribosomal protein L17
VLELVDGPRDLKFEMAARATGWDVLSSRLKGEEDEDEGRGGGGGGPRAMVEAGVKGVEGTIERERLRALGGGGEVEAEGREGELRQRTRWNLRKALRYRSSEDVKRFGDKVQEHMVRSV